MSTRVVVSGIGAVTPLGNSASETWKNLLEGNSGLEYVTTIDPLFNVFGMVKNFDPKARIQDRKVVSRTDPFTHLGVAAGLEAVVDAGLRLPSEHVSEEVGVIFGVGLGGMKTILEQYDTLKERGPRRVSPLAIPMIMANSVTGNLAMLLNAGGPNYVVSTACASANDALIAAYKVIRDKEADIVVTGGAEDINTGLVVAGFGNMKALRRWEGDPSEAYKASRPFDKNRGGFVLAQGAVALVLESLDSAVARGARMYAEVIGYGQTDDAYHITDQNPDGGQRALRRALQSAGISPEDVGYIAAHGTSTPINDANETKSIKAVFGDHAYQLLISSTKSASGHMIGAAGGLNALAASMALYTGMVPPTLNQEEPDPACDLNYVPNKKAAAGDLRVAVSNAFGFGGHNSINVFRKI